MNKKNAYIRITLLLLCITATPSFYLHSSAYKAPGERGRGYTGPKRIRQKPRTLIAPAVTVQAPTNISSPVAAGEKSAQIADQTVEEPQRAQPTVASQAMQAQAAPQQSSPGWLATAYIVFLSTLSKAFGAGIEISYKPLAQSFAERQKVLNAKNAAPNTAKKLVESGEFDQNIIQKAIIESKDVPEGSFEFNQILNAAQKTINLPTEQKIAITTEKMLKKLEPLEEQISFSSMAKDAMYLSLFNTATRVIGGLIGFGATILLQSLIPMEMQQK